MLLLGSEETPICATCERKAEEGSDEGPVDEDATPAAGTPTVYHLRDTDTGRSFCGAEGPFSSLAAGQPTCPTCVNGFRAKHPPKGKDVKNDCPVCGAKTGEPCDARVPHPGFKVGGAPPPPRPDLQVRDIPPPAPPTPEQPVHKLYGYETEDEYYAKEWGGGFCPACGGELDASGRNHVNPEEGKACAEGNA